MQFIITAHDYADGLSRRQAARESHLAALKKLKAEGRILYAAAMVNEAGDMVGSTMICDFSDRAALDAYLAAEPYVTQKVWDKITVTACRVPPIFTEVAA